MIHSMRIHLQQVIQLIYHLLDLLFMKQCQKQTRMLYGLCRVGSSIQIHHSGNHHKWKYASSKEFLKEFMTLIHDFLYINKKICVTGALAFSSIWENDSSWSFCWSKTHMGIILSILWHPLRLVKYDHFTQLPLEVFVIYSKKLIAI